MTELTPHPITLEHTYFTRSVVVAVPNHVLSDDVSQWEPKNDIQVSPIEERPGCYFAAMRTVINPNLDTSAPYMIDMECAGTFVADDTLDEQQAGRGVTITAHSVLFGAIREAVAWITARQPYGPFMLGLSVLRPRDESSPPEMSKK